MDYIIETDRFHKILIKKDYIIKINPKKYTAYKLLATYLSLGCRDYPSEGDFNLYLARAYDAKYRVKVSNVGKYFVLSFRISLVDPIYIKDSDYTLDKIINLFEKCMMPAITDDSFDKKLFSKAKEIVANSLLYMSENLERTAYINSIHELYYDTIRDFDYYDNLEALNKITRKGLYSLYNKVINSLNIGYICGNNVASIKKAFNPDFKQIKDHTFRCIKPHKEYISVKTDNEQSYLSVYYEINSYVNFSLFMSYSFINYAFGGAVDSILFKVVREKYGLCYDIQSSFLGASGLIRVSMITSKENIKLALEKIDECFNNLLNDFDIEKIRGQLLDLNLSKNDYQANLMDDASNPKIFLKSLNNEEENRMIKAVTMDSVKLAYSKMKKTLTYVYGGDEDE